MQCKEKLHFNKVSFTNDKNKKVAARLSVTDIGSVTHEKVLVNKKQFKRKKTLINTPKNNSTELNRRNIGFKFREQEFSNKIHMEMIIANFQSLFANCK